MKHKQIYFNKKGFAFEPSSAKVKINNREQTYVIIRKGNELLCIYDKDYEVFTLPRIEDVHNLQLKPSLNFKTISYIKEKKRYVKEAQIFNVYDLESGKIEGNILQCCTVGDILVHKIGFDETVFKGFKNLVSSCMICSQMKCDLQYLGEKKIYYVHVHFLANFSRRTNS